MANAIKHFHIFFQDSPIFKHNSSFSTVLKYIFQPFQVLGLPRVRSSGSKILIFEEMHVQGKVLQLRISFCSLSQFRRKHCARNPLGNPKITLNWTGCNFVAFAFVSCQLCHKTVKQRYSSGVKGITSAFLRPLRMR